MPSRACIHRALVLVVALLLVPTSLARANQAYEQVSAAYAQGGGHLDPCAFTQAQLEAARAGIPKLVARFVPDLRKAIRDGIAAHKSGDCKGIRPGTSTSSGSPAGGVQPPPETTTAPTTPSTGAAIPTTTVPAPSSSVPATTVPSSAIAPQPSTSTATTPAPQTTLTPAAPHRDRTALAVALIALGALLLLALLLWGWARLRGWDPGWAARVRHAWGEAGYRTTTTWSEFADWLRLGR